MSLRMKRAGMLQRYTPTYRVVLELDQQIQAVERALADAERSPSTEESTNRNPAYEWNRLELAKARSELESLNVGLSVTAGAAEVYRIRAADLERRALQRHSLLRMAKVAEENYLLYLRKQEEARISDALDRERIVDVTLAEAATVPLLRTETRTPLRLSLGGATGRSS